MGDLKKYLPVGDLNERGTSPQWRFSYRRDKIFFASHFDFLYLNLTKKISQNLFWNVAVIEKSDLNW